MNIKKIIKNDSRNQIEPPLSWRPARTASLRFELYKIPCETNYELPMLYTGNPVVLAPGMVFFMHMILMDSENELAMNLGETYLLTDNGNERLGKKKLDLVIG